MPIEGKAHERWDADLAADLPGKRILVGITYLDSEQNLVEQTQLHGRIQTAALDSGILIQLEGTRAGEVYRLPTDTSALHRATPGEYRLRSTGEVVVDPDYLAEWTVYAAPT